MVGGLVVEVVELPDCIYVDCVDCKYPKTRVAIHLQKSRLAKAIDFGDRIWWQGNRAFWTPCRGERYDVELKKIGPSGVKHPLSSDSEK